MQKTFVDKTDNKHALTELRKKQKDLFTAHMHTIMKRAVQKSGLIKLHIGCGRNYFDGWINIDNNIENNIQHMDLQWDLRLPLPFQENSVDYIFNEHFLEHLTVDESQRVLKDCLRVLKVGGVLRVAMPDLADTVALYMNPEWKKDNADFFQKFQLDHIQTRAEYINIAFRAWGHKWLYDWEELERRLKEAGGVNIVRAEIFKSSHKVLCHLETRAESTLVAEVQKTHKKN